MSDNVDLTNDEMTRLQDAKLQDIKNKLKDSGVSDCIECGIPLGLRKKVMPSAVRCIECLNEG